MNKNEMKVEILKQQKLTTKLTFETKLNWKHKSKNKYKNK